MRLFFPTALRILSISALVLLLLSIGAPHARAQTVDELLNAGQPVKRKIAGGEHHYYRIMLLTDQYFRLVVDQRGSDVTVKLFQPDGKMVAESTRQIAAYGPETISWVAESPGLYKLEVRSAQTNQPPGYYEVKILEERTATVQDRNRIPAQKVFIQAEQLREQALLDQAIAKYEEALQSWRDIGDRYGEAETLNVIGLVYHLSKGELVKARQHFEKSLQIWQALSDRRGEAESLNNIARVYESLHESQTALDYYKRSLQPWRDAGDRYLEAWTLSSIGRVYYLRKEAPEALDHHNRALTLWRDLGDLSREAATLKSIGDAYVLISDYRNALSTYEQARARWQAAADANGEVTTLFSISRTYGVLQNKQKESEFNNLAEQLRRQIERDRAQRPEDKARSDTTQLAEKAQADARGLLLEDTEASQRQALAKNEEAVRLFDRVGDYDREVFTLFDISSIYRTLGEKNNERKTLDLSLSLAERVGRPSLRAEALQRLAGFYSNNDQLKAVDYYDRAIELLRRQGDRRSEAYVLSSAAKVYKNLGEKEKTDAYLKRALKLYQDLGDRFREAYTLTDIAAIQEGPEEKQNYLKRTLELRREKGDRAWEAETLKEIIAVYASMGEKREVLGYYHLALALYRQISDRMGEAVILRELMGYWKQLNQPSLAILYGKQAVNTYQEIRRNIQGFDRETQTSFVRSKEDVYRELADLLISRARLLEAQQVLELLKEEEFNNFIRGRRNDPAVTDRAELTPTESELYRQYKEKAERATALSSEYDSLDAKPVRTAEENSRLNELRDELKVVNQALRNFLDQLSGAFTTSAELKNRLTNIQEQENLQNTLKVLDPGSVALYTLVAKDKCRVIMFTPNVRVAGEYSIKVADLNRKVMDLRLALQDPKSDPRPAAQELYNILIKPIKNDLNGANAKTLMWSLDGTLRYVPIAALHDGKNYLVERYRNEIFTSSSFLDLKSVPVPSWRGLGFGVSTFSEGFDPLPAVVDELNGIFRNEDDPNATGGTLRGKIMLNDHFTKDAMLSTLQSRQYKLVHVASHFKFIPGEDGKSSYLVLGKGERLTLAEIEDFPSIFFGVDLLTLSACNTGVDADNGNGIEIDGFGRVAQRRGANAVIATLWSVADASTGLLMQKFYQFRMREGQPLTKAESLQEAQLAFLRKQITASESNEKDYSHPYFWAPFILFGNWQ